VDLGRRERKRIGGEVGIEEHKRIFLEKVKEIGFSVIVRPRVTKQIDKPPYFEVIEEGLSVVLKPESEFYTPDGERQLLEWLETPEGSREAARYNLVNGNIPFTKENVALVDEEAWYISAEHMPKEMHQKFIDIALKSEGFWVLDDEHEDEHLETLSTELEGIHIEKGRVKDIKFAQLRKIKVWQSYYTPELKEDRYQSRLFEEEG
jgi:hypothetical protein